MTKFRRIEWEQIELSILEAIVIIISGMHAM